jgi:hypothetical protein
MQKLSKQTNGSASADTFDQGEEYKGSLDCAWEKITKGERQEAEGKKLWIEGTLELINILHDARQTFGPDQDFGKWLTESGYGENRISRQDRAALLKMALNLADTRKALEETHRRSWRCIWEEEIQPGLPNGGQPARRPKKNGAKKSYEGEWSEMVQ